MENNSRWLLESKTLIGHFAVSLRAAVSISCRINFVLLCRMSDQEIN